MEKFVGVLNKTKNEIQYKLFFGLDIITKYVDVTLLMNCWVGQHHQIDIKLQDSHLKFMKVSKLNHPTPSVKNFSGNGQS